MMRSTLRFWTLCTLFTLFVLGLRAHSNAQTVYVTRPFDKFGTVDLSTGSYREIATTSVQLNALTITPSGTLYGLGDNGSLYTVTAATGATQLVGNPGLFFSLNSLAANSTGQLYGDDPFGSLYTVNSGTGAATLQGASSVFGIYGTGDLAFGPKNSLYSLVSFFGNTLVSRDPSTGAGAARSNTTGISSPSGLTFVEGTLYTFDFFGGIYTIDTTTGLAAATGATVNGGFGPLIGIAAAPSAVPEPGGVVLIVGVAIGGLCLHRQRRRA